MIWQSHIIDTSMTQFLHLRLRDHYGRLGKKYCKSQEICCEIFASQKCQDIYTYEVPSIWLPNQDLSKDNFNRHGNIKGGNIIGPKLRQRTILLRNAEIKRNGLPQEISPKLVIQYYDSLMYLAPINQWGMSLLGGVIL